MRPFVLFLLACGLAAAPPDAHAQAVASAERAARISSLLDGTVCPDLVGAALVQCLRAGYARTTLVSYDRARDFLYGRNGEVGFYRAPFVGVYSGRSGPLGGGGSTTQIDTEHTWPRSMMPVESAQEGEMHNLFPTISRVNNDRGNLPFGDVDDAQASTWYGPTGALPQLVAPPLAERPLFSERLTGVRFEVRADHKGNVARTMAYFYALYGTASEGSWTAQRPFLHAWHRADLPDSIETARSAFIRSKQGNDNPFVLDTSLVRRLLAIPVAAAGPEASAALLTLGPSPTRSTATLRGTLPAAASVSIAVFDVLGRRVLLLPAAPVAGAFARTLDVSALTAGVYFAQVRVTGALTHAQTFTLVRTP